jgi:hypothetical protein
MSRIPVRQLIALCLLTLTACGGGSDSASTTTITTTTTVTGGSGGTSTASVFCPFSLSTTNPTLNIASTANWVCGGGARSLTANGIPDHAIGTFPNPGNPNTPSTQSVSASMTLTPAIVNTAGTATMIIGYAYNGVKFDPGTAQTCTTNCANNGQTNTGSWNIEALGQVYFQFGVDSNNAHVQPGGAYHYHGVPVGILTLAGNTGQKMTLAGFAMDGFPIYVRYGYTVATDASSPIKVIKSSYQLKSTLDAGRPATSVAGAGTFTQDYQYVAGLGDLDECNGRTGVTPEFPGGIYHYYITDTYPYIQRCLKGR